MYDFYDILVIAVVFFWTITLTLFFVHLRQTKEKKAEESVRRQMESFYRNFQLDKNALQTNEDSTGNQQAI